MRRLFLSSHKPAHKCSGVLVSIVFSLCCTLSVHSFAQEANSKNTNAAKAGTASPVGKSIKNFSLLNVDNTWVSLSDYKTAKGFIIVFTCNHCPYAKLYTKRLNALDTKYKPLGFPLLAVNPMDTFLYETESFDKMKKKAVADKFIFPYLVDAAQTVAQSLNATHTPQAYVICKEGSRWVVKYSGAIDDNAGHPENATPFIANAVDELLHNKPVSKQRTESLGCRIYYRSDSLKNK